MNVLIFNFGMSKAFKKLGFDNLAVFQYFTPPKMSFDIWPYISAMRPHWTLALGSLKSWVKMLSKTLLSLLKIRYIGYVVNTFNQGSSYFVTKKPQKSAFFHHIWHFFQHLQAKTLLFSPWFIILELQRWFWHIEQPL